MTRAALAWLALVATVAAAADPLATQPGAWFTVAHGARSSLTVGLLATLAALLLGLPLGVLAGTVGGAWDGLVERLVETTALLPTVVVAALLGAAFPRAPLGALAVGIAAARSVEIARLARALALRAGSEEWALAARATGVEPLRFARVHLLPHAAPAVLAALATSMSSCALVEAALSFLGLGAASPGASWGGALGAAARGGAFPWPSALALGLTAGAWHLVAEALAARGAGASLPRAVSFDPCGAHRSQ